MPWKIDLFFDRAKKDTFRISFLSSEELLEFFLLSFLVSLQETTYLIELDKHLKIEVCIVMQIVYHQLVVRSLYFTIEFLLM